MDTTLLLMPSNSQHFNHPITHVARHTFSPNSQNSNIITRNVQSNPTVDPASIAIPFSGINNLATNGVRGMDIMMATMDGVI